MSKWIYGYYNDNNEFVEVKATTRDERVGILLKHIRLWS